MAEERKIPVLLLVVPHCAQLGGEYAENMQELGMENVEAVTQNQPEWPRLIDSTASNHAQTQVGFTLQALKTAEDSTGAMFFPNDPHLQPTGYTILTQIVSEWLQETLP